MYFHPKKEKFNSKYTYQLLYNVLECGDNCEVQIVSTKVYLWLEKHRKLPLYSDEMLPALFP